MIEKAASTDDKAMREDVGIVTENSMDIYSNRKCKIDEGD